MDAPERIWRCNGRHGQISYDFKPSLNVAHTEYIRADIHAAELEAERDEAWNAAIEAAARTCAELVANEQSFTRWRAALDCSALVRLLTRAAKGGTP